MSSKNMVAMVNELLKDHLSIMFTKLQVCLDN